MAKKVTKKKTTTKKTTATKKRTSAPKRTKTAAATPATPSVTDDAIRVRAFEIYRAGENPSNPDADWIQAEQELAAGVSR